MESLDIGWRTLFERIVIRGPTRPNSYGLGVGVAIGVTMTFSISLRCQLTQFR